MELEPTAASPGSGTSAGVVADLIESKDELDWQRRANEVLRKSNQDLALQIQEAEVAARLKAEFIANLSHEMRTPLNTVIGFAQMLGRDYSIAGDSRNSVDAIAKAGQHLLALINDVLDDSKLEAGKMRLVEEPLDPTEFVHEVAAMLTPQCLEKGLLLRVVVAPEMPKAVFADPTRVRQMLLNLLSNAVKFTQHGEITLTASSTPLEGNKAKLLMSVKDTGVGIAASDLPRLFRRFQQVGKTGAKAGGSGLGLSITRQLAQIMGGDVEATSAPGVGSEFRLTIVVELAPQESLVPPSSVSAVIGAVLPQFSQLAILVVDDVDWNRQVLGALLKQMGFTTIRQASGGQEALKLAAMEPMPALIFLDIHMPGMNGIEVARILKDRPACKDVPLIAVSASTLDASTSAGIGAVFDDFLSKPIELELLRRVIERHGFKFSTAAIDMRPLHVLVVDDQPFIGRLIQVSLVRGGHTVELCESGTIAIARLKVDKYDVVLVDRMMPGLDGLETMRRIVAEFKHRPYLIMTSADFSADDASACLDAGAHALIEKPITLSSFERTIARLDLK